MSNEDGRGAPARDYNDWNAALDAVDRLARVRDALPDPLDEAQLDRDLAEIRKAALALSDPPEDDGARDARRRRLVLMVLGGVWISMAIVTAASLGALLFLLT